MGKRLLLNLLLAAVVIALALFIYLRPGKTPDGDTPRIADLDPDAVSAIQLTRLQAEPLMFERRDGRWHIKREPALPADDFQVNTLLALARAETGRSYAADALDLATMGLEPPQASALLDDVRFDVGITDPIDGLRYVMTGANVHLVADRFQHLLNARYTNFVERRLLPASAVVTGLSLPGLSLRLGEDNHWQLLPDDPTIGADAIRTLVSTWENARALYVREYDGAAGEEITVTLKGTDNPVMFVLLPLEQDIVFARPDRGIQYHLTEENGLGLLKFSTDSDE